jgi:hypothetical protein
MKTFLDFYVIIAFVVIALQWRMFGIISESPAWRRAGYFSRSIAISLIWLLWPVTVFIYGRELMNAVKIRIKKSWK